MNKTNISLITQSLKFRKEQLKFLSELISNSCTAQIKHNNPSQKQTRHIKQHQIEKEKKNQKYIFEQNTNKERGVERLPTPGREREI